MRSVVIIVLTAQIFLLSGRLLAGEQPVAEDELTKLKREYADVLALQGTSKARFWQSPGFCTRIPRSRSIRRRRVANIVSTAATAPWFTSLPSRSARRKMLCMSSTRPGLSREAWTRRACNSYPDEAE
jgi:hypothetical protein